MESLKDGCEFPYTALCSWPLPQPQIDWVDVVQSMELWLETHVGVKGVAWDWIGPEYVPSWVCAVMFKDPLNKTLFLLRWGQ